MSSWRFISNLTLKSGCKIRFGQLFTLSSVALQNSRDFGKTHCCWIFLQMHFSMLWAGSDVPFTSAISGGYPAPTSACSHSLHYHSSRTSWGTYPNLQQDSCSLTLNSNLHFVVSQAAATLSPRSSWQQRKSFDVYLNISLQWIAFKAHAAAIITLEIPGGD